MLAESDYHLGIDDVRINEVGERVDDFWTDDRLLAGVVRGTMTKIRTVQPDYVSFLGDMSQEIGISNMLVYGAAAMIAHELVPVMQRLEPLKREDLTALKSRVLEQFSFVRIGENRTVQYLETDWMLEELEGDSPDFVEWIRQVGNELDEDGRQYDFKLGCLLAVMPFHLRNKSRILA